MAFGYFDTSYLDFAPGIDPTYLAGLATRDGVSFQDVLREIDGRLGSLNGGTDPLVASLLTPPTTDPTSDTTTVTAFDVTEATEYTIARPQVADAAGIMLPIKSWDVALGFTEKGLKQASRARILQQVDGVINGMTLLQRRQVLKRLFSIAEVRVDRNTTITSPGFAGSGTGNNVFTGNYPDGTATSSLTHYARIASGSLAAGIKAGRDALKRWVPGPYHLIGPQSQIDAIVALGSPDFVPAANALVTVGSGTAQAQVDVSEYVGVFAGDILVHQPLYDFSDANIALFKSFGAFDSRNPLTWRYDEQEGRAAYLRMRDLYPLSNAVLAQTFGIGVNQRTYAYLITVAASGSYVDPTIS